VADRVRLAAVAGEWASLVLASVRPAPFVLPEWIDAWWQQLAGRRAEPLLVLARQEGRLTGGMPLVRVREAGLRVLRPLGEAPGGPTGAVVLAPGEGQAAVLTALTAATRGLGADLFRSRRLRADEASGAPRLQALGVRVVQRAVSPELHAPDGWDDVFAAVTN